jgi:hypothetical protein
MFHASSLENALGCAFTFIFTVTFAFAELGAIADAAGSDGGTAVAGETRNARAVVPAAAAAAACGAVVIA